MKLPDDIQYPGGHVFDIPTNIEPTKDQDIINGLRCENAYLRGKIAVYEKLLKDKGFIGEEESRPVIANGVEYDSYADYLKSREEEE